jgi:hypothetical protein
MFRSIVLLVGGLASLSTVSLFAQEAVLGQEYGSGVHAYFTGDATKAYERLTAAIDGGSKDPRAFYFRGLAYLKLGRPDEAKADFRKGADLESKDVNRFYNVGKALERVQGQARSELETYRVDARMAALEELEKVRKSRYEAIQREEARVVREQAVAAPEKPIEAAATPEAGGDETPDPFATPEAAAPKKGGKAAASGDANPFEPSAKPDAKAPAKKSGTAVEKKPATGKKAAVEKKPADDSDPFGGDAPKATPKKPAAEKKGADDSDPFGGDAPKATPKAAPKKGATEKKAVEKKPAEKKKAGDEADPFAP